MMSNRLLVTLLLCASLLATLIIGAVEAFQPAVSRTSSAPVGTHGRHPHVPPPATVSSYPTTGTRQSSCALFGGFLDEIGGFMKRFTTKATASHILIKGGAEAEIKLADLKADIGDSPVKFAEAAAKYSDCPSGRSGGSLGEFGPGAMVKEFDQVVFKEDVGAVHGPIKTQFGYHLIYINDRSE
jgi:peptidyl-prolyl cis-trans isomerase C